MNDPVSVPIDFPSLDSPYDPTSPSENLTAHPEVFSAINKIVAACGQMSATVQPPFLTICDATMGYHLPSCMRLFEASHTPEILKKAGPNGMHVKDIAEENGVDATKLAHILRLLCVHHLVREISPNVFANNRVSSMIDSGKSVEELKERYPEKKYENSNGIAAFVGLCTDELQKSSAFLTEAYFLSPKAHLNGKEPTRAPFNYAFGCEGMNDLLTTMTNYTIGPTQNPNQFRLERFGIAMAGTDSWEVPGAVLNGFDWQSLPRGSLVVDVGGGIGPTMMLLAHAFSRPGDEDAMDFRFIIQDRQVVVDMGEKAWRAKCPEYLELDIAKFQVKKPAVFFLRVVLHDWPTDYARMILLHLREAASPDTKLLIADFIIPLACRDNFGSHSTEDGGIEGITGAENLLAPAPLLPNLGKASANVYWMDLTMQVTFNGQERTLREIVALTRSAGWKVTRVVKAPGSHFGHITAVP
ncbi:S-adenosyl-L-methionine-dependent methyltransferase, partial [Marasmius fiardii PR-910]